MTAEEYFASFAPAEQQRIRASWGGQDLMRDWYQNAVNAGAVPGNIPNASILQGTGASGYNPGNVTAYRSIDPNIIRNMTPQQRAVWSMENIDDLSAHGDRQRAYAQWMTWQSAYDPSCPPGAPYRAEDGSGCVEKPDNTNKGYQAAAGQSPMAQAVMPWQGQPQVPQQGFPQIPSGARPWGETGGRSRQDLASMLTPYMGAQRPMQSATGALVSTLKPMSQVGSAQQSTMGTGWTGGQDGLTQMMARQQRRPGQYGGAAGSWWA